MTDCDSEGKGDCFRPLVRPIGRCGVRGIVGDCDAREKTVLAERKYGNGGGWEGAAWGGGWMELLGPFGW